MDLSISDKSLNSEKIPAKPREEMVQPRGSFKKVAGTAIKVDRSA